MLFGWLENCLFSCSSTLLQTKHCEQSTWNYLHLALVLNITSRLNLFLPVSPTSQCSPGKRRNKNRSQLKEAEPTDKRNSGAWVFCSKDTEFQTAENTVMSFDFVVVARSCSARCALCGCGWSPGADPPASPAAAKSLDRRRPAAARPPLRLRVTLGRQRFQLSSWPASDKEKIYSCVVGK